MKNLVSFLIIFTFFACSKDVVTSHKPVSSNNWRTELVKKLQSAKDDTERNIIMKENGIRLTTQLVHFLKSNGYNCRIDTIEYHYGSGKAKNVASGDGDTHDGHFKSQPYAVIKGGPCFKGSMYVFILCFNGTFELSSDSKTIGNGPLVFTIQKGKGLNYYVDYQTSIWIAETFSLPIYRGNGWDNTINSHEALALENNLSEVKVTVKVFPGDRFDLRQMTLNGESPK